VDVRPVILVTPTAALPHTALDPTIFTTFVDASAMPDSCSVHGSDRVHRVDLTWAPEIWKDPIANAYVASWLQQRWKPLLAAPAVAVPRSKVRKPAPDALTENVAPT
jgi:hypothetical protein